MSQRKNNKQKSITDNRCALCDVRTDRIDALGFSWCEEHSFRGDLIDKGPAHNWQEIHCEPYAIGPGKACWAMAATAGNDDFIYIALGYIEWLENGAQTA